MKYREIADGIFVDRPNRFIAHVEVNGAVETVHVKNTGRCRELLLSGTAVRLEVSDNPKRKKKYDLVAVHKQGLGWVNMDSQAPNKVVGEWLAKMPSTISLYFNVFLHFQYRIRELCPSCLPRYSSDRKSVV